MQWLDEHFEGARDAFSVVKYVTLHCYVDYHHETSCEMSSEALNLHLSWHP